MTEFIKLTEQPGLHRHLEKMSVAELIAHINEEDKKVAPAVEMALPQIEQLILAVCDRMLAGGRLFYMGAGTSGRLGVLDASEIPPTYGMPQGLIVGLIAGGEDAIRNSIENAEDSTEDGWADLQKLQAGKQDFVLGIAASGTTPYVIGALARCRKEGIATGCITCNAGSPLAAEADYPIEVLVGPEIVTGSTRMKSGTAQKMVLNMISTSVMIQLGRVEDNRMVNMQLTNAKLIDRGTRMLMERTGIGNYAEARELLVRHGSVRKAVDSLGS